MPRCIRRLWHHALRRQPIRCRLVQQRVNVLGRMRVRVRAVVMRRRVLGPLVRDGAVGGKDEDAGEGAQEDLAARLVRM
jgi:hypothetical protein